jgi:hypothetical protein
MSTPATNAIEDSDGDDDVGCDDPMSGRSVLLATGSALPLGYLMGRVSYSRALQAGLRRIEESPEQIEVSIRSL